MEAALRFAATLFALVGLAAFASWPRFGDWRLRPSTAATGVCGNGVVEGTESCDDGNRIDGDGCAYNCQVEFWARDFRLNANATSTPGDPAGAVIAFTAQSDGGFQCTTGVETVTQGTSPVTYLGPLGLYALDMTGQAMRPVVSSPTAGMANVVGGSAGKGSTIIIAGSPTNFVEGASGVEPMVEWTTGAGSRLLVRYENDNSLFLRSPSSAGVNEANAANGLPGFGGWGLRAFVWDGGQAYVRAAGTSGSPAAMTFTIGTTGAYRFGADDGTGNPNFTSGELRGVYVYDGGLNDTWLTSLEMKFAGMGDSTASPVAFTRNARGWIYAASNEPYAPNTPIISARGWESQRGNDTGSGNNSPTGNGFGRLGLTSWPKIGTPLFSDAGTGPCSRYINTASAFLVTGDAGDGFEGDGGTTGCFADPTKAGEATLTLWVAPGTTGTTQNEICLGFDTDWVQLDGGNAPDLHFYLDAGWQRIRYPDYFGLIDAGNPDGGKGSYLYGHVKLCGSDAGTQSVLIDKWGAQCDWYQGETANRCDNVNEGSDFLSIPSTEVVTWPDGQADAGADIEVVFAQNFDSPGETTGLPLLNWQFLMLDGGSNENYLFIDSTDGTGFAQPTLDVGWRNASYQSTCLNQSLSGLTDTKSAALPNLTRGTYYAARVIVLPAGSTAGVPRVNHYLYFNACPNQSSPASCHATTLVGSSVGQGKCASEAAQFGFGVLGREINNTTSVSASVNPVNAAVSFVAIRRAVKPL